MPTPASDQTLPLSGDMQLVARILRAEPGAFEALMRRFNRVLFRTARSVLKDDAEAEDAVQDAYLLAYRALPAFRADASLSTWLTRIVLNVCFGRRRKSARRAEIVELQFDWESGRPDDRALAGPPEEEPDVAAIRSETRRLLERKIDELPEAFRTVFVLRELEEMGIEEVAGVLGIPEATVRTRHFRGRAMLREALSREIDVAMADAFSFDGERCDRIVASVLGALSGDGAAGS
ncbi:RNA polymerase sigma factor [Massilia niastensis]|uniref:RNA polymerase sigma factor n=1 Tax=Massilia niastensis TaxID=544911 RepID=UPI0003A43472|nr:RNA polymerase sigma factor [Massilia niastensis]